MRHGKKVNHLGRKTQHRKLMLGNMACSLILHKRIKTTVAKAKALKRFVEPLITRGKENSTHNRRMCFRYLQQKEAVTELFSDVAAKIADRPGGYTRIIRIGNRYGDNAEMCIIELVDYNEIYTTDKKATKAGAKKRRSRRGGGKKEATANTETTAAATAVAATESTKEAVIEKVEQAGDTVKEVVVDAKDKVIEVAADVKDKAEEVVADAKDKVEEVIADVKDTAEETTDKVVKKDNAEDEKVSDQ